MSYDSQRSSQQNIITSATHLNVSKHESSVLRCRDTACYCCAHQHKRCFTHYMLSVHTYAGVTEFMCSTRYLKEILTKHFQFSNVNADAGDRAL